MRRKYYKQEGNRYRMNKEVRAAVTFDRLNLQDQTRMLFAKGFDLIFCCNVLIYFDGPAKKRTVEHFYNGLIPGGHFFLGECETLFGVYDQFRLVHFPGATGYYKPAPGDETGGREMNAATNKVLQQKVSRLRNLPAMPSVLQSLRMPQRKFVRCEYRARCGTYFLR